MYNTTYAATLGGYCCSRQPHDVTSSVLGLWPEVSRRNSAISVGCLQPTIGPGCRSGDKLLYREFRALERARERRKRRDNWFRKGGLDTVIFIPAAPGSQLKRRYMREIKATDFKIKVVEQSGTTLLQQPCYKDQTPSNRGDAGLTRRDHAEVQALHTSWFARLVNRRMSEKRPEVRILVVENTSML